MSRISSFRRIESKHEVYRDTDCLKKFCEYLREPEMKIINFEKKKNKIISKREAEII